MVDITTTIKLQISSHRNPRIKHIYKLRERRTRDRCGQFIIEGYRELFRAHQNNYPVTELYVCPELLAGTKEKELVNSLYENGVDIIAVTDSVFRKLAYREQPEGLLGIAPQKRYSLQELSFKTSSLILVAEAIEKPGNIGAMMRSADATATDAVILCQSSTDIFNPNVVRASTGTLFNVPVAESSNADTLEWLRQNNITTVVTLPQAGKIYSDIEMTAPLAIVVGAENCGLSDFWQQNADAAVNIPMLGIADSLNVNNCATLLLYEALRQRRGKKSNN